MLDGLCAGVMPALLLGVCGEIGVVMAESRLAGVVAPHSAAHQGNRFRWGADLAVSESSLGGQASCSVRVGFVFGSSGRGTHGAAMG